MRIVIDTNILLVCISSNSEFRWIFDSLLDEDFTLCVTTDILIEYEEILGKHMGKELASTVLQIIENAPNVEFITKYFSWNLITADPDDNKFVDCAVAGNVKYLVSHDRHFKVLEAIAFPKVIMIDAERLKEELRK
ncbi:MAG: putative toxin-antitoxin system toxin component, PIN family [Saprospiraceae bacterium]|nr:MAG: putative toxin-antitoxin system toxin component, PIN family [Saprospiraceae bacterium]